MKIALIGLSMLALGGCATTYQMNLMPRDSGKQYVGTVQDNGSGEGRVAVTIEGKAFEGTWVGSTPERTQGWLTGGLGFGRGRWGWGGFSTTVLIDNPHGSESKALLNAPDGSGLRCDFRIAGNRGGGICRDDRGREYDVQLRPASRG